MFDRVEAFYRPANVREALRLLHSGKGRARIVAGGTDVAAEADRSIRFLVDITQAGLSYVRREDGAFVIGATTTMATLENSPVVQALAGGILAKACANCGSVQIRNMATLGGNLANASPAAETAAPLLALDAELVVADQRTRHRVPLAAFYTALRKSVLAKALIVEIVIPAPSRAARWSFQKLGRTGSDISLVNAAAGLRLDSRGRVKWVRIALGAVASTPLRIPDAEALMTGKRLDDGLIALACDQVARDVRPITDVRASAEYRRSMSSVLTRRALEECAEQLQGCPL